MGPAFHPASLHVLCVNLLQAPDPYRVAHARGYRVGGGARAAHGGDAGDAIRHRAAADGLLIEEGRGAGGGVDGHLDCPAFQQVYHVGAALVHLEHHPGGQAGGAEGGGGAARGHQVEAEVGEAPGGFDGLGLDAIAFVSTCPFWCLYMHHSITV